MRWQGQHWGWGGSFLTHYSPFLPGNYFFAQVEQGTKRDCVILLSEVWFISTFGKAGACLKHRSKILPLGRLPPHADFLKWHLSLTTHSSFANAHSRASPAPTSCFPAQKVPRRWLGAHSTESTNTYCTLVLYLVGKTCTSIPLFLGRLTGKKCGYNCVCINKHTNK